MICIIISPTADPMFKFSNELYLIEERTALMGSSVFINCSVNYVTEHNSTLWVLENE